MSSIPDAIDADAQSALFFAQANRPRDIVIFGLGAENIIASLLKFDIDKITYVVEDRTYYETVYKNIPDEHRAFFDDPRLDVVFDPARTFLKYNRRQFDIAIVYCAVPSSLIANSFFTRDFYLLLKESIKDGGVIATQISGSENYISQEASAFGSSLFYTLRDIFPRLVITPGTVNWFFAGSDNSPLSDDPERLKDRLAGHLPESSSFDIDSFRGIFLPDRVEFVRNSYADNSFFKQRRLLNTDLNPRTFFLNLVVIATRGSPFVVNILKNIFSAGFLFFLVVVLIFFGARLWFLHSIENTALRRNVFNGKVFQFFSGFLGFSTHLTLIYLFQNKFAMIFQLIGIVTAIFMLGLFCGGFLGKDLNLRFHWASSILLVMGTQILLVAVIYLLLVKFAVVSLPLFALLFFVTGVLTGSSYPLCARIFDDSRLALDKVAVFLELYDYWGSALGGLLAGVCLVPVLGVTGTLALIAFERFGRHFFWKRRSFVHQKNILPRRYSIRSGLFFVDHNSGSGGWIAVLRLAQTPLKAVV